MTLQFNSATLRDGWAQRLIDDLGASPKLIFYGGGAPPANCAAAPSSDVRCTITAPGTAFATIVDGSGEAVKTGTWSALPSSLGPIDHFRLWNNAVSTCFVQGLVSAALSLTTTAATAVNGNTLPFASTAGVNVGDDAYGAGIPLGALVLAKTSTTVTLSMGCPAGVASGTSCVFGDASGDITIGSTVVTSLAQAITIDELTFVAPGA